MSGILKCIVTLQSDYMLAKYSEPFFWGTPIKEHLS